MKTLYLLLISFVFIFNLPSYAAAPVYPVQRHTAPIEPIKSAATKIKRKLSFKRQRANPDPKNNTSNSNAAGLIFLAYLIASAMIFFGFVVVVEIALNTLNLFYLLSPLIGFALLLLMFLTINGKTRPNLKRYIFWLAIRSFLLSYAIGFLLGGVDPQIIWALVSGAILFVLFICTFIYTKIKRKRALEEERKRDKEDPNQKERQPKEKSNIKFTSY